MIILTRGNTEVVYLTLSEYQVTPSAYYLINFTNRLTQDEVELVVENISDNDNIQKVEIDVNEFEGKDSGFYTYQVWASNVGGDKIGSMLENGYMDLRNSSTFNPTGYSEQSNNFKAYNG